MPIEGYGLPAAIAGKLVHTERAALYFAGEGCFLMSGQELATAAQYKLNVLIIVVNNGLFGSIRMHQERHYPGNVWGTTLPIRTSPYWLNPTAHTAKPSRKPQTSRSTHAGTCGYGTCSDRATGRSRSPYPKVDRCVATCAGVNTAERRGDEIYRVKCPSVTIEQKPRGDS